MNETTTVTTQTGNINQIKNHTSFDETLKKLLFLTKEYKKVRSELERISQITMRQHEQMKYQQFTMETMENYIRKQQQEINELKNQIKMEKELCEDVIQMQNKRKRNSREMDNNYALEKRDIDILSGDDYDFDDNELIKVKSFFSDEDTTLHNYYKLLALDNEEELHKLTLEDEVAQLKQENHKLLLEVAKLKEEMYSLKQLQKHQNLETSEHISLARNIQSTHKD
jgi:hypothetical protein